MLERLGNLLYWLGNTLAVLFALLIVVGLFFDATAIDVMVGLGAVVLCWLAGRPARHHFAGK